MEVNEAATLPTGMKITQEEISPTPSTSQQQAVPPTVRNDDAKVKIERDQQRMLKDVKIVKSEVLPAIVGVTQDQVPPMSSTPQQQALLPTWSEENAELKIDRYQERMTLVLHALKCQRGEPASETGMNPCLRSQCWKTKNVLTHLRNCKAKVNCPLKHCWSTRTAIHHWNRCKSPDCALCLRIRHVNMNQFNAFPPIQPTSVGNDTTQHSGSPTPNISDQISCTEVKAVAAKSQRSEEFRKPLAAILQKLIQQEPESQLFRELMDPTRLRPDYADIIKKPMDFITMKNNVLDGTYSDPWECIDHVHSLLDNVKQYNIPTSTIYRYSTKLTEIFELEIDSLMQSLGYCCGRRRTFNPQALYCAGKMSCIIPRSGQYYSHPNGYAYCIKCFDGVDWDTVNLVSDSKKAQIKIEKGQFVIMMNDDLEPEPFIECLDCGQRSHQICVLHVDRISPDGFHCNKCLEVTSRKRKKNDFSAKRLQTTVLGAHIESRVNNLLKMKGVQAGDVVIRVMSSSNKTLHVKAGMKNLYVQTGHLKATYQYSAKAIFAFQEMDGVDVFFFGMYVQEYDSESPFPNTRRVYISYMDSVDFFRPRQLQTAVHYEIVLSYLDFVKQLGFATAHFWIRPPTEGDDIIFYGRPPGQHVSSVGQLRKWYLKLLEQGVSENIIVDYRNIFEQGLVTNMKSARELPYFDWEFWPEFFEKEIQELEIIENERESLERMETHNFSDIDSWPEFFHDAVRAEAAKAELSASVAGNVKKEPESNADREKRDLEKFKRLDKDLSARTFDAMDKNRLSFFILDLHAEDDVASLASIHDPDPLIQCELMERDAFLAHARENNYEFSTLRKAKFSTMALLDRFLN